MIALFDVKVGEWANARHEFKLTFIEHPLPISRYPKAQAYRLS